MDMAHLEPHAFYVCVSLAATELRRKGNGLGCGRRALSDAGAKRLRAPVMLVVVVAVVVQLLVSA